MVIFMGSFGYICPVCKTAIIGDCFNGGEKCILIHKRNGKEVGRTEGHYGEYGNVIEDKEFRGDNESINSHEEICKSEFGLEDSYKFGHKKVDKDGAVYNCGIFHNHIKAFVFNNSIEELESNPVFDNVIKKSKEIFSEIYKDFDKKLKKDDYNKFLKFTLMTQIESDIHFESRGELYNYINNWCKENLKPWDGVKSGIIAVHSKCYNSLSKEEQDNLPFSESDPNQSWGEVREEYKQKFKSIEILRFLCFFLIIIERMDLYEKYFVKNDY